MRNVFLCAVASAAMLPSIAQAAPGDPVPHEQTFDAVRLETNALGPVAVDVTYALSQHTVFSSEAGPRTRYDGDFVFGNAVLTSGPLRLRGFDYLVDYSADEPVAARLSSNTVGVRADYSRPVGGGVTLTAMASYARQYDVGTNASDYAADYFAGSIGVARAVFALRAV
ncbi:MAG: hypothetical protein HC774_00265 [Sphingomonadales bacterium]|nr:hypothetical protein [Sphingomonadales bacterium]